MCRESHGLKLLPFAKCFHSSTEDLLIILENMKAQGYTMVKKKSERERHFLPCAINFLNLKNLPLYTLARYDLTTFIHPSRDDST
jgi:hypothetical protein